MCHFLWPRCEATKATFLAYAPRCWMSSEAYILNNYSTSYLTDSCTYYLLNNNAN